MPRCTYRQLHSKLGSSSLLQRPRTMITADGPGMQSNFSNIYNFLMPLSVSVFNQRLMIPLRKHWQISSVRNHSRLLTNNILYNISCRLSSQHLSSSKGHLESWIILNLSKPHCPLERWPESVWKQWTVILNSPACFIYCKKAIQMPLYLKELSAFTSATHLPLLDPFFLSQKPHCNSLGLLQDLLQYTPAQLSLLSMVQTWCSIMGKRMSIMQMHEWYCQHF